jgi:hypothetical protein
MAALAAGPSAAAPSAARDIRILNFLLLLEHLQSDFYSMARARSALRGELAEFARVAGRQEREHVASLKSTLGPYAARRPRFDLRAAARPRSFGRIALALEELTAAAYIGQSANLTPTSIGVVARIASVEGRHAAWIRDLLGELPAPAAADTARAPAEIVRRLRALGLVGGHAASRRRRP